MKFYRLLQTDNRYGMTGNVIDNSIYTTLPYTDKPLYAVIDANGRGYPYKVTVGVVGTQPALYYIEDYEDIILILERLADRAGVIKERIPLYIPKSNGTLNFAGYTITILYRKEWEQQDSNSLSQQGT